jgi:hypothetical protein
MPGPCCCTRLTGPLNLTPQVARCFRDGRDQDSIVHTIETFIAQRIHGLRDVAGKGRGPARGSHFSARRVTAPSLRRVIVIGAFTHELPPHHLVECWDGFRDVCLTLCWREAVEPLPDNLLRDVVTTRARIKQARFHRLLSKFMKPPIGAIFPAHTRTPSDYLVIVVDAG